MFIGQFGDDPSLSYLNVQYYDVEHAGPCDLSRRLRIGHGLTDPSQRGATRPCHRPEHSRCLTRATSGSALMSEDALTASWLKMPKGTCAECCGLFA